MGCRFINKEAGYYKSPASLFMVYIGMSLHLKAVVFNKNQKNAGHLCLCGKYECVLEAAWGYIIFFQFP